MARKEGVKKNRKKCWIVGVKFVSLLSFKRVA